MSALPKLSEELFIGRRDNARAMVGAPGRLILLRGFADCILMDISCTGARIATSEMLNPGTEVLVLINDVELFGQIVWGKRGQFGMVFDEPIPVEDVIQLRWQAEQICQQDKAAAQDRIRDWVEGRI